MPRTNRSVSRRTYQWVRRGMRPTATSEAALEKLFSSIQLGIASIDRDGNYLRVNTAYARAAGARPEDFPGLNHFQRFSDPDLDRDLRRALETGQTQYAYSKVLPAFRPRHYWDWTIEPVARPDGKVESLVLVLVDVTAREQAQQALSQSQALFAHLFESAPDANILLDAGGRVLSANQQAEILFGAPRASLIGLEIERLVLDPEQVVRHHLEQDAPAEPDPGLQTRQRIQQIERTAQRVDGSQFPAEITLSPFQTERGWLLLCVIRDISERAQHESELQEKTELVRLLQDVAAAANESNSVQEAFQYTVDRLCQHLNWPIGHAMLTEEAALSPAAIWHTGINGSYSAFRAASDQMSLSKADGLPALVLSTGQPVWLNDVQNNPLFARKEAARKDGLHTALSVPVLAGKDIVGLLEFFHTRNITPDPRLLAVLPHIGIQLGRVVERRRSEDALRKAAAQLRMVIVNLPVILWVVNREGRLIMLEGQGVEKAGISREMVLGQPLLDMLTNRPDIVQHIQRALAGETIHTEIYTENGTVFETYYTPYYDENWAVDGVIGLSFDITQRKRMEGELEEMKRLLLESKETEQARLGKQLHDGPLQDLYGAFYQIQDIQNNLDGAAQETAGRALQTIQQVNAMLRVICGDLHPTTLVHLGLSKAIRSHAEMLQERVSERLTIHLDLPDEQDNLPHALRLSLFRVYQQFISNAIDHANARHVWVRLRTAEDAISLEVQDNGVGFSVPGRWLDLVRQGRFGLASAFERVTGLNGTIDINSRPGWGTLVRVRVPLTD